MNPKVLQYLMGHSDISVTLNTYTHLKLEDAREEMNKLAKKKDKADTELQKLGMMMEKNASPGKRAGNRARFETRHQLSNHYRNIYGLVPEEYRLSA